jgi:hypothetical protein
MSLIEGRQAHQGFATTRPDLARDGTRPSGLRDGDPLRLAYGVSWLLVALMAIESLAGLVVADMYPEAPWAIAAFRGNDLVTLALVVPVLALALLGAARSPRWLAVWLGALLYGVYNFAYYAFGAAFNDVFLLHVASMSGSIVALIALCASIDARAVAATVRGELPARLVGGYMLAVGGALAVAWGGLSLRFAFTGELPDDVMPPSAVHLVYALDLGLLAPSFLAGGLLLLRRAAWGPLLAAAVNVFGATYLIVLEMVGAFQTAEHIEGKVWVSPPAVGGAILCALAATAILRRLEASPPASHAIDAPLVSER